MIVEENIQPIRQLNDFNFCYVSSIAELDDGAYNPLWATRGFTQTFHFWKEHRRQQSTPLNAFLTYVTLPWWSIAKGEWVKRFSQSLGNSFAFRRAFESSKTFN